MLVLRNKEIYDVRRKMLSLILSKILDNSPCESNLAGAVAINKPIKL
jgi:hypothetical protein